MRFANIVLATLLLQQQSSLLPIILPTPSLAFSPIPKYQRALVNNNANNNSRRRSLADRGSTCIDDVGSRGTSSHHHKADANVDEDGAVGRGSNIAASITLGVVTAASQLGVGIASAAGMINIAEDIHHTSSSSDAGTSIVLDSKQLTSPLESTRSHS